MEKVIIKEIKINGKGKTKEELKAEAMKEIEKQLNDAFKDVKEPKKDETPGPNYVPPKFGNVTPIHFPRPRRTRKRVEKSPGPQDYSPQYDGIGLKHVPATIGNGKRPSLFNGDPSTPSAANYNPHYEPTRPKSPRVVIGRKYKEPKKDRTGEFIAARSTLSPRGASFGRSSGRTLIMHI